MEEINYTKLYPTGKDLLGTDKAFFYKGMFIRCTLPPWHEAGGGRLIHGHIVKLGTRYLDVKVVDSDELIRIKDRRDLRDVHWMTRGTSVGETLPLFG